MKLTHLPQENSDKCSRIAAETSTPIKAGSQKDTIFFFVDFVFSRQFLRAVETVQNMHWFPYIVEQSILVDFVVQHLFEHIRHPKSSNCCEVSSCVLF